MRKNFIYSLLFITSLAGSFSYADIPHNPGGDSNQAEVGRDCKNSAGNAGVWAAGANGKLSCIITTNLAPASGGCNSLGSASTAFVSLFSLSLGFTLLIRSRRRTR